MRAAVLNEVRMPLAIEGVPVGEPLAGEALVRVIAAGVCHSDLHLIEGTYPARLPAILGHEVAGIVERVGPGVTTVQPGDRVILGFVQPCGHCSYCHSGHPNLCGTRTTTRGRDNPALKRGEASHKAEPAVILGIQKQPGANTLALTRLLDLTLDDIERTLPKGMRIDRNIFRQADFIERSLDNLSAAIIEGSLLVVVVLLFLVNFRAAFVTLLALPLSLLAAILGLQWMGLTINAMSLGGLAIAIGVLVDDAIIDVENVMRRRRLTASWTPANRTILCRCSNSLGSMSLASLMACSARFIASSTNFSSIWSSAMARSARTETLSPSISAKPPPMTR